MKLTAREMLAFELGGITVDETIDHSQKNETFHSIGKELRITPEECNELFHEILDVKRHPDHLELHPDEFRWLLKIGDTGILETYPSLKNAKKMMVNFEMFHRVNEYHYLCGNMHLIREDANR